MSKINADEDLIRKLADLMDETGLTEIEIGDKGHTLRVSKGAVAAVATAAPAPAVVGAEPPASEAAPADDSPAQGVVTSPMVGTAYLAPEPGAPVFIRVGDKVEEGQTILIIEAMKTMNSVAATHGGTVKEILVENQQPVEYGQPLVIIG